MKNLCLLLDLILPAPLHPRIMTFSRGRDGRKRTYYYGTVGNARTDEDEANNDEVLKSEIIIVKQPSKTQKRSSIHKLVA